MAASTVFTRLEPVRLAAHGAVNAYLVALEQEMVVVLAGLVGRQVASWRYDGEYALVVVGVDGEEICVDVETLLHSPDAVTFTAAHFVLDAAFTLTKLAPVLAVLRAESPAV
jgi:hypothetical protein